MNGVPLFARGGAISVQLGELSAAMSRSKKVDIEVDLGEGSDSWTAWGCDLSHDYVKINADYTS